MLACRMDERNLQYIILQSIFFLGNQVFLRIKERCGGHYLITNTEWLAQVSVEQEN